MRAANQPTPIPPDLLDRLGKPDKHFDNVPHYLLARIAAAIGCSRTTLAGWFKRGSVRAATKHSNAWYISAHVLREWAAEGVPEAGTFPVLSRTNNTYRGRAVRPRVGEPGSLVGYRPAGPGAN